MKKIRNIFYSCSKWTTCQQCRGHVSLSETGVVVVGGEFSLSSSSSSRMGFPAEPPISKSSNAVGEKGVSKAGLKQRVHPTDHFPSRNQRLPDQQTPDTRLCPAILVQLHFKVLRPSFHVFVAGTGLLELVLDDCSRTVVFEITTNSKLPEDFLGDLLSLPGRDLLQSESLNVVQNRKSTQYRHWRLRKSCCFNVD